ncbi:MAG: hypothetical protein Kow00127_23480 [Bacteroidales bacterium]
MRWFSRFFPEMEDQPVIKKWLVLLLLMGVGMALMTALARFFILVIWGAESLKQPGTFTSGEPGVVGMLRFMQLFSQLGLFVVPAIVYGWLMNRQPIRYLKLDVTPGLFFSFLSLTALILFIPAVNRMVVINEQMSLPGWLSGLESWMRWQEDQAAQLTGAFLEDGSVGGFLANLLIIGAMAAIGEEFLFRGVFIRLFHSTLRNIHAAVFLSAFLFSALHLQFFGFFPRLVLGILFGYLFIWSGSLLLPVILHFIFNSITIVGAWFYARGMSRVPVDDLGTGFPDSVVISSLALFTVVMYLLYRRRIAETF